MTPALNPIRVAVIVFEYGWKWILRRIFRVQVPLGDQSVSVGAFEADFASCLEATYPSFRSYFEADSYRRSSGFKYSGSARSFSHLIYATVVHYRFRRIYEIGTYFGTTTMMLLRYFKQMGTRDFHILTIDKQARFDIGLFSERTRGAFSALSSRIDFVIGDSREFHLNEDFDLAIIDGSHWPSDVMKDFDRAKGHCRFVFFDDLHMYDTYQGVYQNLLRQGQIKEVFRAYTTDCDGRDPHLVALAEVLTPAQVSSKTKRKAG